MFTTIIVTAIISAVVSLIVGFVVAIVMSNGEEELASLKQSLRARIDNVDKHLHDIYERQKKESRSGFNNLLALLGYAKMMISDQDGLVLVEDFKGNKFIADTNIKPIRFVPAKEVKTKKGMNVTEYKGKTYEFEAVEKVTAKTDF